MPAASSCSFDVYGQGAQAWVVAGALAMPIDTSYLDFLISLTSTTHTHQRDAANGRSTPLLLHLSLLALPNKRLIMGYNFAMMASLNPPASAHFCKTDLSGLPLGCGVKLRLLPAHQGTLSFGTPDGSRQELVNRPAL